MYLLSFEHKIVLWYLKTFKHQDMQCIWLYYVYIMYVIWQMVDDEQVATREEEEKSCMPW
jgi:hypothetical protein